MQLLVVILNKEEYLDELLTAFLEIGIRGATIIDSVGMGRIISQDVTIFSGLRSLFDTKRPANKTIFSVIEDDALVEDAIQIFEKICGSLDDSGTGVLFTLPVNRAIGLANNIEF